MSGVRCQETSASPRVEMERVQRSNWAWEVRINGRTYARCRCEDDARKVAHALRIAGDADSDSARLARIQSDLRRLAELR